MRCIFIYFEKVLNVSNSAVFHILPLYSIPELSKNEITEYYCNLANLLKSTIV